jgi:hypothetical protein
MNYRTTLRDMEILLGDLRRVAQTVGDAGVARAGSLNRSQPVRAGSNSSRSAMVVSSQLDQATRLFQPTQN